MIHRSDQAARLIGPEPSDLDLIIESAKPLEESDPADDELPGLDNTEVTQLGDLWKLGEHRLFCGNSLEAESFETLLGADRAQMVFSDPPYNVPIDGNVSGLGKTKHGNFAMASGEMSKTQFIDFLTRAFTHCTNYSIDGSIHFQCMDWRHIGEILAAGDAAYDELKNLIAWIKNNGGMGSFYRSRHEFIFVFKNGIRPHINNFELGQKGRYRTNVWQYGGANSAGASRLADLELHPTVKPVQMIADAMLDCSKRGGIVLDPFGGSGSTLIAAKRTKRRARLIELDPIYVDRTIRRWEQIACDDAIHVTSGMTFSERKNEILKPNSKTRIQRRPRRRLPAYLKTSSNK